MDAHLSSVLLHCNRNLTNKARRVHDIIIHIQLKDGKIWIEWDGTTPGIVQALLDGGIPKEELVLAFYTPEHRKLTDFAVA